MAGLPSACAGMPYHPLIDALAHFAARYTGDVAYLHGVGPEVSAHGSACGPVHGPDQRPGHGSQDARSNAPAEKAAPVRARYSMLGMRSYRRSSDLPQVDDDFGAIGYCAYDDRVYDDRAYDDCAYDDRAYDDRVYDDCTHGGGGRDGWTHAGAGVGGPSQWRWFDRWIVEDHATGTVTAIALGRLGPAQDALRELHAQWDAAFRSSADAGVEKERWIDRQSQCRTLREESAIIAGADQHRDGYIVAVRHMQRHMRDGDIYVANMSMRLDVRTAVAPLDAFRNLYACNPSLYAAYLDFRGPVGAGSDGACGADADDADAASVGACAGPVVVSSSPERFLRIWDGVAVTEPIKGTRPRGRTAAEDSRFAADLHASAKEQAELLMVTDLERNDMNCFCEPGSVTVPAYEAVRAFPHVFHTVSVVEGRPRAGTDVADALRVMSPGGSITGTPKRRAMEIIGECERSPRGVYTGSLGYVGVNPSCWLAQVGECGMPGRAHELADEARGDESRGVVPQAMGADAEVSSGAEATAVAEMGAIAGAGSGRPPQVCDLSIVIRTAVMTESSDASGSGEPGLYTYRIGAGGGVTLESDPAAEWDEAVHKARAVLAALGVPKAAVDLFARSGGAPCPETHCPETRRLATRRQGNPPDERADEADDGCR